MVEATASCSTCDATCDTYGQNIVIFLPEYHFNAIKVDKITCEKRLPAEWR